MEMPEGWKRLRKTADLLDGNEIIWIGRGDKDRILDLMKEMAEALKFYESDWRDAPPQMNYLGPAQTALKKFREWK